MKRNPAHQGNVVTGRRRTVPTRVALGRLVLGASVVGAVLVGVSSTAGATAPAPSITTVAGNFALTTGCPQFSGDGGSATAASLGLPFGVTTDSSGNTLVGDWCNSRVRVVAASTGTFYGQAMTAGDIYTIAGNGGATSGNAIPATTAGIGQPKGLALDAQGNIVISAPDIVRVVAESTANFYGQAMTAGDIYTVAGTGTAGYTGDGGPGTSAEISNCGFICLGLSGVAVDGNGNIVLADTKNNVLRIIAGNIGSYHGTAVTPGDIYTEAGNGTAGHTGDGGLATSAELSTPTGVAIDASGNVLVGDYGNNDIRAIAYTTATFYGQSMTAGDVYTIAGTGTASHAGDGGAAASATFNSPADVAIDSSGNVLVADSGNNDIRVIAEGSSTFYGQSMTAGDIYTIAGNGTAGYSGDGGQPAAAALNNPFGMAIDASGNVLVGDTNNNVIRQIGAGGPGLALTYTCTVPSGPNQFPVTIWETPSPPSNMNVNGTFQTAPQSQLTIPAASVNFGLANSVTSVTFSSVSFGLDAVDPSGNPSGAMSPNTQTTTATNLPVTLTYVANTQIIVPFTFNPVTWKAGPGTGSVDFVPGVVQTTYTVNGNQTFNVTCYPPGSQAAALGGPSTPFPDPIDSTTVNPAPATPTLQLPSPLSPQQAQVTPGGDAGWAIPVSNVSTAAAQGVSLAVSVSDGGPAPSFDLTAMANSGTTCTSSSPGAVTCAIGTLAGSTTSTLYLLVLTNGLTAGTTITGTANATATNASPVSAPMNGVGVIVISHGVAADATSGTPLPSTTAPPSSTNPVVIILTLSGKKKHHGPIGGAGNRVHRWSAIRNAGSSPALPPVAVILEPESSSAAPALCPASSGGCKGGVAKIEGNFSAYTNKAAPIKAVITIFYGATVPAGSIYMEKDTNDSIVRLPPCAKTAGFYSTPCVFGKEKKVGAKGSLSTQDTVYFVGTDPLVGRR